MNFKQISMKTIDNHDGRNSLFHIIDVLLNMYQLDVFLLLIHSSTVF